MFRQVSILLFTILFTPFSVFCQFDLIKVNPSPQPTVKPIATPTTKNLNSTDDSLKITNSPEKAEKSLYEIGDEIVRHTTETFDICSIAYSYGISCEKLAQYNKLDYNGKLPPKTKVKILVTSEIKERFEKLADLKFKSSIWFKQGLLNLRDARGVQAGEEFNKAIEIFLMSGLNVNRNWETLQCYNVMIETIYRIEFPSSNEPPQIRNLASICEWSWNDNDYKVADAVAKIAVSDANVGSNSNSARLNSINNRLLGFNEQKFEVSPLDELAKLELTSEETQEVPQPRPLLQPLTVSVTSRTVFAKTADTVTKLAEREGISAVELAKYNGLLPTSILTAGREIKIPLKAEAKVKTSVQTFPIKQIVSYSILGPKPAQAKDGKVGAVLAYMNEVLHDPYSMRFVRWSEITRTDYGDIPCWRVQVKYRAKNLMGAYVLAEEVFYIRKNKVIKVIRLD